MYIPQDIWYILKNHNAILAGGALLSQKYCLNINDWDIYFKCEEDFNSAVRRLEEKGVEIHYNSKYAISYYLGDNKVQLIRTLFGDIFKVLNSFDLKMCQIGYDLNNDHYLDNDSENRRVEERDLDELLNPEYNRKIEVKRLFKYKDRGFISEESLLEFLKDRNMLIRNTNKEEFYQLPDPYELCP
jgi:hypothetical protein